MSKTGTLAIAILVFNSINSCVKECIASFSVLKSNGQLSVAYELWLLIFCWAFFILLTILFFLLNAL